jgi:uncharacterized membrane protein
MTKTLATFLLGVAAFVGATRPAGAATHFQNTSSNTIWAAHKFDSTWGFGCGYDDGCDHASRMTGWWQIAPGGITTVDSRGWGNARHEAYAEDGLGHYWEGGDPVCLGDNGFNTCQYNDSLCNQPTSTYYSFFFARNTACCGGTCPTNGTIVFPEGGFVH